MAKGFAQISWSLLYGPETIKFVTRSAFEIMQRLHAAETKGDPNLLLDIFFLPTDEGSTEPKKKPEPGKPDVPPPPPPPPPPPKPKCFVLESIKGGFLVKPGNTQFASLPAKLRIEAGYAVRRGNAIKRWASDDFAFMRQPVRQDPKPKGVMVTREDGNCIELEIRKPDFLFGVSGFDTKRDLVVRAIEMKETMKRTFNFTGRRNIVRKDVSITIHANGNAWVFDADLKLAHYKFPHNAEIWIEAHRQNLWMQWPWGNNFGNASAGGSAAYRVRRAGWRAVSCACRSTTRSGNS